MNRLSDIQERAEIDRGMVTWRCLEDRAFLLDLVERAEGMVRLLHIQNPQDGEYAQWLRDVEGEG